MAIGKGLPTRAPADLEAAGENQEGEAARARNVEAAARGRVPEVQGAAVEAEGAVRGSRRVRRR